jgi:Zn-dependent protease
MPFAGFFLGRLFGVPVTMDLWFILTVGMFSYFSFVRAGEVVGIATAIALILTVLLHELGHGIAARLTGMSSVRIHLTALGGFCAYEGQRSPGRGLIISVAGVTVNFLIAAAAFGYLYLGERGSLPPAVFSVHREDFGWLLNILLSQLFIWNLVLGIFNSLPLWPLDGGRALFEIFGLTRMRVRTAKRITFGVSVAAAVAALGGMHSFGLQPLFLIIMLMLLLSIAYRDLL